MGHVHVMVGVGAAEEERIGRPCGGVQAERMTEGLHLVEIRGLEPGERDIVDVDDRCGHPSMLRAGYFDIKQFGIE